MAKSNKHGAGPDLRADSALVVLLHVADVGEVATISQKMCERRLQLGAYAETDAHR